MKDKMILYNHFHNGDIFFSRIIIRALIDYYDINYYHNLNTPLLIDIDGLVEFSGIPNFPINDCEAKNKIVNTWIGQKNMSYVNAVNHGCSSANYFKLCTDILDELSVTHDYDEEYLLPTINYSLIEKPDNVINLVSDNTFRKKILFSNGDVHSGQSSNFNFEPIIEFLSEKHSDVLFLLTQKTNINKENVIHTCDLTEIKPDLLLISYISSFCDIIVGRASGPYCYSQTKENLLSEDKTFIAFCGNINEGKFYDKLKSNFVWSNNYSNNNIIGIIDSELKN